MLCCVQVYERAKYHLLQCATGESVLRLDKTELHSEAKSLQEIYLTEQHHETLHNYLVNQLPVYVGDQGYDPLFLQVRFSRIEFSGRILEVC